MSDAFLKFRYTLPIVVPDYKKEILNAKDI